MPDPAPSTVVPLTPPGEAALAVFDVRGAAAVGRLKERFRPRGSARAGAARLQTGVLDLGDGLTEEVVVRFSHDAAPPFAEISTHGGIWLRSRLPGAFADLPTAAQPAESSADSADSVLEEAMSALRDAFTDAQTRFFLGAGARFNAEASRVESLAAAGRREDAVARLSLLRAALPYGIAMSSPPSVVLYGAVNAGKSTLFNALLGEARALTSEEPGTTRDVIEERCSLSGFPFVLCDTAGARATTDPVEREGSRRGARAAATADVRVRVVDAARSLMEQDGADVLADSIGPRVVVVARRSLAVVDGALAELQARRVPHVACDALSGDGVDAVRRAILAASPFATTPAGAVPFASRHVDAVARRLDAFESHGKNA